MKDPYAELGLDKDIDGDATDGELDAAYRRRAKQVHPDVNKSPGAPADFDRASKAIALLKDPQRRRRFHETGEVGEDKLIDATRAGALGLIDAFIDEAIGKYVNGNFAPDLDPRRRDLIAEFRDVANGNMSQAEAAIITWGKAKRFLEDMAKRWSSTDAENPVRRAIRRKLDHADDSIKNLRDASESWRKALEIMGSHTFEWDRPEREPFYIPPRFLGGWPS